MPLKQIITLHGHMDRVWTLAWNSSGTILASSGGDKRIRLWAKVGNQWQCVAILDDTHEKSIRRLSWSPCGNYIASASFDSTVSVWKRDPDNKSWSNIYNLEGHSSEVKSVAWSHDGQFLATCGRDKSVWIWERASNSDTECSANDEDNDAAQSWDCSDVKSDHSKDVKNVIWHPKANILISCSYDDTAKLFHKEGDDWKCHQTLSSHNSTVWSADFSASGEFLVTCSDDKTVRVWKNHAHDKLPNIQENSWKCVSVIQGYHTRTIYDVSWNKITDIIVSASGDNSLVFYAKTNEPNSDTDQDLFVCIDKHSDSHESDINVVAWNPEDSNILATGSDDRSIKIWHYDFTNKGMMQPLTIVDEIMSSLKEAGFDDDHNHTAIGQHKDQSINNDRKPYPSLTKTITDFTTLLIHIQSLQNLQNEIDPDLEIKRHLEHLFDLKLSDNLNSKPLELSNLLIDDNGMVDEFTIKVLEQGGDIKSEFRFKVDMEKFKLVMPKRSTRFLAVGNNLFLLEKTGDMFKILPNGTTEFLLGHLFTFSDVKFLVASKNIHNNENIMKREEQIKYVISADRDEKIRVSNFPETFKIERFCFGHKSFVQRLFVVDDNKRFISIDQDNNAILWNLTNLGHLSDNSVPIKPQIRKSLNESQCKRIKK